MRNTLIEMNLTLVRYVARGFSGREESTEDMLHVGAIGLIKAIDRYDVSRGVEFTTLAIPYIQREIKDSSATPPGRSACPGICIDLARSREQLEGPRRPRTVRRRARHSPQPGRDRGPSGSRQQTGLVADVIGSEDPALALAEDIQALNAHLVELNNRDRTLLELRFGAEMAQMEIGKELGLSQMHVSRLITRICAHLRLEMLATC
ncbi:sigma-70 family RNA polymerase sigma factor [Streptomyces decoyicus]|uniref:sigma-70 family RNA polymerase sigma factor n=1 Tax=Streptomyces decoyicus TaxID=249567 RepID=UPI000ABB176B|nr:sigma-70 family RNA polymerase sigma factor [Streptomyces decoyicus]